jgi:hypothetical protein
MSSNEESDFQQESEAIEAVRTELKTLMERSTVLALAHKYTARRWSSLYLWLGIPSAVLAGVSGVSALSSFDNSKIITGILSILVASLTALNTFLDPSKRASNHLIASNKYDQIKDKARSSFLVVTDPTGKVIDLVDKKTSPQILAQKFEDISIELQKLNSESPMLPKWAIREARNTLKELGDDPLRAIIAAATAFIQE